MLVFTGKKIFLQIFCVSGILWSAFLRAETYGDKKLMETKCQTPCRGAAITCATILIGKQFGSESPGKTCFDTVSNFSLKIPELLHLFLSSLSPCYCLIHIIINRRHISFVMYLCLKIGRNHKSGSLYRQQIQIICFLR